EKRFPEVTLIKSDKNRGWGGGTNLGLKQAMSNGAEYMWLLNNDLVVEPDTLSKLVAAAEKSEDAALVGPVIYHYSARTEIQNCGSIFDWERYTTEHFVDLGDIKSVEKKNFWLWFTAIMVKREVVENVGFFDERYFIYFDDMDYSARAMRAGYQHVLEPTAKVYHRHHKVDSGSIRKAPLHYFYYNTRNDYWFWKKMSTKYKTLSCFRIYLARVLRLLESYKKQGWVDISDVCLDGLWCSIRGIGGPWDTKNKMPAPLKKLIMSRPYFWSHVFEGNIGGVFGTFAKKIKRRSKTNT
ncbi:glycosyltransferase family 2 protein, partial [Planctomycetota bacterium]